MSNEAFTFRTSARWSGNRSGHVGADDVADPLLFSAPPEFHGESGRWTPETLFVAAAGTCFLTTLVAIADFMKLELASIEVPGEARVERVPGQGYQFTEVILRPVVTVANGTERSKVDKALAKAEKNCLVARALQTTMRIEPAVHFEAVAKGA